VVEKKRKLKKFREWSKKVLCRFNYHTSFSLSLPMAIFIFFAFGKLRLKGRK